MVKFEESLKKLIRGFYGIGAVGWAPNPDIDFEMAWKRYLKEGIIPEWRTHPSDWKEKMPLSTMYQDTDQLDAANKRIKELENALADMITAPGYPIGLRAWILEAFKKKWMLDDNLDPATDLEQVLDGLNIK